MGRESDWELKMPAFLNKRKCPAQEKICTAISACPINAITYQADDSEPLGGKIVIDDGRCNDCGACVAACCGQAIELR
jgi:ferredoxin